jgi:hypothetical protein
VPEKVDNAELDELCTFLGEKKTQSTSLRKLTGKRGALQYCPDQIMNHGHAAIFILRGNFGNSFVPNPAKHIFKDDWTKGPLAESWAETMY